MIKSMIISMLSLFLLACATMPSPRITSELNQGERYFNQGHYREAMQRLLPLACEGNPKAQYAVGYMYYYGLGVSQDKKVSYFWISQSARQHYPPAQQALQIIYAGKAPAVPPENTGI